MTAIRFLSKRKSFYKPLGIHVNSFNEGNELLRLQSIKLVSIITDSLLLVKKYARSI